MAVRTGEKAPDFRLKDQTEEFRSLSEFSGKTVVLAFVPAAFTGVCTAELCSFRDDLKALTDSNTQVVVINKDSPFANNAWSQANSYNFPILSDVTYATIQAYGVEFNDFAGIDNYMVARRSIFVIDATGTVKWVWLADSPGQSPNYDDIRAAIAS